MDDYAVERVLLAVEQIPSGRVASYGDLAALTGTSARRVGTIMRTHGSQVTWWRVVGAAGEPGGGLMARARPHWIDEGIEVKPNGKGCRIDDYRADRVALEHAYRDALAGVVRDHGTPLPAIGAPATRALAAIGVTNLEQVIDHSEPELLGLHGFGPRALRLLVAELDRLGWAWPGRSAEG